MAVFRQLFVLIVLFYLADARRGKDDSDERSLQYIRNVIRDVGPYYCIAKSDIAQIAIHVADRLERVSYILKYYANSRPGDRRPKDDRKVDSSEEENEKKDKKPEESKPDERKNPIPPFPIINDKVINDIFKGFQAEKFP